MIHGKNVYETKIKIADTHSYCKGTIKFPSFSAFFWYFSDIFLIGFEFLVDILVYLSILVYGRLFRAWLADIRHIASAY